MKTILAPLDFSPASDAVIAEAAALTRALNGRLVLLAVVQPPVFIGDYAPLIGSVNDLTAEAARNTARRLASAQATLKTGGLAADTIQRVGSAISEIVAEARKLKADFIVMGSHGHTAFYDLLVGSTTHGVLMRSGCPVLVVPASKKTRAKTKKRPTKAA